MDMSLLIIIILSLSFIGLLAKRRTSETTTQIQGAREFLFRKTSKNYKKPIPTQAGLLPDVPLHDLLNRLEQALSGEFGSTIKARVMAKHPEWTDREYKWVLFEWKRYFLMASLFKSVPMYSDDADEIWHEMIMFTREYEKLCLAVAGEMIHHEPHIERKPDPEARARFDILYSLLFEVQPASWDIWGRFFRYPLSQETARQWSESGEDGVREWLFRNHALIKEETRTLSKRFWTLLQEAHVDSALFLKQAKQKSCYGNLEKIGVAAIVYSLLDPFGFEKEMQLMFGVEMQKKAANGGSSCGSSSGGNSSCGSSNHDCNHGGHSCSSGGGSSCGSSCGGGCGSS